ncbi:peptidoglycan-binding domain-containing protein [sulfur-oxidizing endosymbiont of Gigantopelta aegis]|uniref:peptidoglycan-binding domain-containing protein n=1 Tax=sulfur-oxidizing endosymbiont of Gigantopelta aegis TaxID=2794934 RepID=UPI0018DE7A29|nr:peptidoglycan-binding domain-containing protein [sulfur-oxidizing endosymbiont of Gigantopelta aegis]
MLSPNGTKYIASFLFLIASLLSQGAIAADKLGQFGIRGAGLISCQIYENERKAKADVYLMAAAWIDGYITATNEHVDDTYDILSFETTELLTEVLDKHCKKNPNDAVITVIRALLAKLRDDRLQFYSKKIEISIGERQVSLYIETLKRIQQHLKSAGFYKGKINGKYDQEMLIAMQAYQQSIAFKPTGFPDQATLWRLLRTAK